MKCGMSTACLYPMETEVALEEIGKAGIKMAEIFFNCESELKDCFVDELLAITQKYGVEIAAIHPTMSLAESFMIFSSYERRFYEALKQYTRYSQIAKRLGAKYIVMHGGKPNGICDDEEYCRRYMTLNDATKQNGVSVLQENVVNYRSGNVEFLRSMVNIIGEDARLCFDIKQSIRCGLAPMELIEEFYPYIKHFHISDHSMAGDCLIPDMGGFDFKGLFEFLTLKGYGGALITEVYSSCYGQKEDLFGKWQSFFEKHRDIFGKA